MATPKAPEDIRQGSSSQEGESAVAWWENQGIYLWTEQRDLAIDQQLLVSHLPLFQKDWFYVVILYLSHLYAYGTHGADTLTFSFWLARDIMVFEQYAIMGGILMVSFWGGCFLCLEECT